jgi:hypothetical protein
VWDKSFFRTEVFTSVDHLRTENAEFVEFHNTHHRYSAHAGATPNQMWQDRPCPTLPGDHQPPTQLPAKGRIEVVRYIRSNRQLALFGKRITLRDNDIHQYVTAIIKVRTRKLMVVDTNGEIIHNSSFNLSRELR